MFLLRATCYSKTVNFKSENSPKIRQTNRKKPEEGKPDLKTDKPSTGKILVDKNLFLRKHKQVILDWAKDNKSRLIEGRKNYSWNDKAPQACLTERNEVSESITFSRTQNSGGVDLETLDMIMSWGGFSQFPLRDEKKF